MFDKEELSIVSGLFPNTLAIAEAEKLGQQEAAYKRFSGAAGTQNPFAGLAGLSGMFGTAAGQELRGLTGVQSPTTRLASLREQAAQQFNPNSPDGLVQMAQFLNQNGDSAGARQAIMLAQGQAQRSATLEKTGAETARALREKIGTPENQAEQAYYNNLLTKYPDTVEGRAIAADDFAKWKTAQKAKVAAAGATIMPGEAKIPDLRTAQSIVNDYLGKSKESLSTVTDIKNYGEMIKAGNSSQLPQFQRALVKLVGDSQIGQNELKNILGSAGIAADIVDGFTKFLTGAPTNVKIDDVLKGVEVLQRRVETSYTAGQTQAREVLSASKFDPKIVDNLVGPALKKTTTTIPLTEWLTQAKQKNPNVSDAELTSYYNKKYGK